MHPSWKTAVVALAAVLALETGSSTARAQTCYLDDPACDAGLTSILLTIGIPITVAGLVIALTFNVSTRAPYRYRRVAELYLRQNHNQLVQDLVTGNGPMVADLAGNLELPSGHLAPFGELLRAHRQELRGLADLETLTPDRAEAFFRRLLDLAGGDVLLGPDMTAFRSHHPQPT